MKKVVLFTMVIIAATSWWGCEYKKEVTAFPQAICDTSNVRYSVEITGILAANCYTCHASAVANANGGGNMLEGYNNLKPYADSKEFLYVVQHAPGYDQMPKNGPMLSDCDIAKIRIWVNAGAPNN